MKGIQLTSEQKQLLVEALLFSSVTDINSEWSLKHSQAMIELAAKFNDPNIKLSNIYLFEADKFEEPELVNKIIKDFPNIPQVNITD